MKVTIIGLIITICFSSKVNAELLQILHINDLHSHLDHAIHRESLGGYARLKVLLKKYRQDAAANGIGTIAMDGGDFMEGNMYYMADRGKSTFRAFNNLGLDVAVLGNHDYLMGAQDLDDILRDVPPSYNLLAANFELKDSFQHVKEHIKPVWETTINGIKVGVIGITLNDLLFEWRLKKDGKVDTEIKVARRWAKYLKSRGNQIVIALTHIGLSKDKRLAQKVPEIDLIVGGHSHTAIHKVVYQKSRKGKMIPIVQAGKHGEWLGKILLDYDQDKKQTRVVEYGLLPILSETKDPEMLNLIKEANDELYSLYGDWLNEVVGKSMLRPINEVNDETIWHFFINDSMMEAIGADFSVHVSPLSGNNYPLGDVTRRSLYNGNPRTFEFDEKMGYKIYSAEVTGIWIKMLAPLALNFNLPAYFSGISFKWKKKKNGKYFVWDVRHNGKLINPFKRYKVAFSEAIVRGGYAINPLVGLLFHNGINTNIPMWQAMEDKFKREGVLAQDYLDRYYRQQKSIGYVLERMMVPASEE